IIATGLFIGLYLAQREANRLGLKKDTILDLIIIAAPVAIIFARIYYVIFEWEQYQAGTWWKVFAVWEGGIAINGDLIEAVLTGFIFARLKDISFITIADTIAPDFI